LDLIGFGDFERCGRTFGNRDKGVVEDEALGVLGRLDFAKMTVGFWGIVSGGTGGGEATGTEAGSTCWTLEFGLGGRGFLKRSEAEVEASEAEDAEGLVVG